MGSGVTARTLHEHLRLLAGIVPTREQRCRTEFWQDELPAMALEALLEREGDGGLFDDIVLDEAQDVLRRSYLDALDLSLRGGLERGHWRFFGDFTWQRIYDAAALSVDEFLDPPADARASGAAPVSAMRCELRINCRNTPRVAGLACAAGHVSPGYRRVRRPDDAVEPELRWYGDAGEQLELLRSVLTELRAAGFTGPRVAVLSPYGNERCAAAQLTEQPWRDRLAPLVREPGEDEEEEDVGDWLKACIPSDLDAVDLRSGAIKYASIYRFKGLESPAVVITDVEAVENHAQRSLDLRRLHARPASARHPREPGRSRAAHRLTGTFARGSRRASGPALLAARAQVGDEQGVAFRDQLVVAAPALLLRQPGVQHLGGLGRERGPRREVAQHALLDRGEVLHVADDAALAAAQVVEQMRPHGGPAQAGAAADGLVDVLDGGDAAQHEVHRLAPQRGGEAVGTGSRAGRGRA